MAQPRRAPHRRSVAFARGRAFAVREHQSASLGRRLGAVNRSTRCTFLGHRTVTLLVSRRRFRRPNQGCTSARAPQQLPAGPIGITHPALHVTGVGHQRADVDEQVTAGGSGVGHPLDGASFVECDDHRRQV